MSRPLILDQYESFEDWLRDTATTFDQAGERETADGLFEMARDVAVQDRLADLGALVEARAGDRSKGESDEAYLQRSAYGDKKETELERLSELGAMVEARAGVQGAGVEDTNYLLHAATGRDDLPDNIGDVYDGVLKALGVPPPTIDAAAEVALLVQSRDEYLAVRRALGADEGEDITALVKQLRFDAGVLEELRKLVAKKA